MQTTHHPVIANLWGKHKLAEKACVQRLQSPELRHTLKIRVVLHFALTLYSKTVTNVHVQARNLNSKHWCLNRNFPTLMSVKLMRLHALQLSSHSPTRAIIWCSQVSWKHSKWAGTKLPTAGGDRGYYGGSLSM